MILCSQHLYAGVSAPGRCRQSNKISVKHTICTLKQIEIEWNFSSSDTYANVIIPSKRPLKLNIYYIFCTSLVKATTNSHEVSAFVRNALRLHFGNVWKLNNSSFMFHLLSTFFFSVWNIMTLSETKMYLSMSSECIQSLVCQQTLRIVSSQKYVYGGILDNANYNPLSQSIYVTQNSGHFQSQIFSKT
jgi:hypothetical protein